MPKRTYQIQFATGGYADVIPSNRIKFTGAWVDNTMIWRESISEFTIGRLKNATIYDTLETWFTDPTKFETIIYIKVLKAGVQESIHWFGVKWGTINRYEKTFTVQPIVYDYWSQYFEQTNHLSSASSSGSNTNGFRYYSEADTYTYIAALSNQQTIEQVVKNFASEASGWSAANVVSSFLFGDAYEDTSAVGTYRGMPLDYVTGEQSYLVDGGIITEPYQTFDDILEWLKIFRIWLFFDSNNKLRLEHVKFFTDKLIDNAVDYSAYIKNVDNEWRYEQSIIPISEKISISVESDDSDIDFNETDIIYNGVRNKPDTQPISHQFPLKTNLGYYNTAISENIFMVSGLKNQVYKWFDIDMDSFSSDFNSFDIDWGAGINNNMGSNDIYTLLANSYDVNYALTTSSGTWTVSFIKRSTSALISNVLTFNGPTGSGTLTMISGPHDDAYIHVTSVGASTGSIAGWLTVEPTTEFYPVVIPTIDGVASGAPKSNGAMSVANIIESWWQDDRLSRAGVINGNPYTFNTTQYNLIRKDVRMYYAGTINPLFGFNDGTRIARIRSWEHDADTDFYLISLTHQEDE